MKGGSGLAREGTGLGKEDGAPPPGSVGEMDARGPLSQEGKGRIPRPPFSIEARRLNL